MAPHPEFTTSHTVSFRSILILFSHELLGLRRVLFTSDYGIKVLYIFLLPPMHATCPLFRPLRFDILIIMYVRSTDYDAKKHLNK
jgi:hypothetical protein